MKKKKQPQQTIITTTTTLTGPVYIKVLVCCFAEPPP